jgi:hypothetical protein
MNVLTFLIVASAICAYVLLAKDALEKITKGESGISFSSLLLWSIIDCIMLVNTIRADNDYALILTYTVLTIILTLILVFKKQYMWSKSDTLIALIAFSCLIVSYLTPPQIGVACGALSIACAGIPNIIAIAKNKTSRQFDWAMYFFLLSPICSLFNEYIKGGEPKDFVYPIVASLYWSIALMLSSTHE